MARTDYVTIGNDELVWWKGAINEQSGNYLNSATVTASLYTSAGVLVPSSAVTLAYVAASNGNYNGILESAVTATLTDGAYYTWKADLVQGGIVGHREWDVMARYEGHREL